jgi:lipopolysaccharide/colanic/teichoic acid biosynthesis glycosyltransferase
MLLKRAFDLVGATVGLVLTAPILGAAAVAVRATMGSPVLFKQVRPGLRGVPFTIFKLRTMSTGDASDAARLTRLGKFLRATSIDELPQFWNVLRGEMSIVGPRPLLMEYLPLYSPRQARRHDLRPGVTSWAAVHGRNLTEWDARLEQDVWYVENQSFALDLKIIAKTVMKVVQREGINQTGQATRSNFSGNVATS